MDIQGLARYLNIRVKTLYAKVREIPHYKVGRLIRFKKEEVDDWMKHHRVCAGGLAPRRTQADVYSESNTDIDRLIRRTIDQVKGEGYTPSHGKSDRLKGLGEEV